MRDKNQPATGITIPRQLTEPMRVSELARIFGVHRHTMQRWLNNGLGVRVAKGARYWRVAVADLPPKEEETVAYGG